MPAHHRFPDLKLADEDKVAKVDNYVGPFKLTIEQTFQIMSALHSEMLLGLSKDEHLRKSSLQMENTYIRGLYDGTEIGDYLALDLGGTHFRVLLVTLKGKRKCITKSQHFEIPPSKMVEHGVKLFGFIADCIHSFLSRNNLLNIHLYLGFTFSFPMTQKSLTSGILITWTKHFKCPGVVGEDAVKMLKDALDFYPDLNIEIVAVLNDTTGTLMAGAFKDSNSAIGLILGTGCNACYMEKIDNIAKWDGDNFEPREVIIDIEWGAFGDNGVLDFMKNEIDFELNADSNHINSFTFEKLFAGMYLGEIVRLVLVKLTKDNVIFQGKGSSALFTKAKFHTEYISRILKDEDTSKEGTISVLEVLNLVEVASEDDMEILHYICDVISKRGALIVSAGLAQLLIYMDRPETSIAIDGSLYSKHPTFSKLMKQYITELAPGIHFKLVHAEDGSGTGAGLVAAVAVRVGEIIERERQNSLSSISSLGSGSGNDE